MRHYFTYRTLILFALLCLFTAGAAQNSSINIRAKVFLEGSLEVGTPPDPVIPDPPAIVGLDADTSFNLSISGGVAESTQVRVDIAATDENGDITITWRVDDGGDEVVSIPTSPITIAPNSEAQRTAEFTLTAIGAGNTTVTIIVRDSRRNTDEVKIRVEVGATSEPVIPEPVIVSPTDGMSFDLLLSGEFRESTQVSVVIAAGDENGDITMTLQVDDIGIVSTPSSPITISPADGATQRMAEFTLTAIGAGNTTVTIVVTDSLDKTAEVKIRVQVRPIPAPEITSPTAGMSFDLSISGGVTESIPVSVVINAVDENGDIIMALQLDEGGEQVVSMPDSPIEIAPNSAAQRTAEFMLTAVGAGNTTVTIAVTDSLENRAEVTIRVQVRAIPAPEITSPTAGMSFNLSIIGEVAEPILVPVVIAATDANGDITMTLEVDDDEVVSIPTSPITIEPSGGTQRMAGFTLSAVGAGNTTVTIVIRDRFGNEVEVKIRVQVTAISAPVITSPMAGMSFSLFKDGGVLASTQVQVVVDATDANGDITMTLQADDEGIVSIPTSPITIEPNGGTQRMAEFTLTAVGEGNTTVTIVIRDRFDNEAEVKIRVAVEATEPPEPVIPEPVITSPTAGMSFSLLKDGGDLASTQVQVVIEAGDENGTITMTLQVDDGGIASIPTSPIMIAPNGGTQRTAEFTLSAVGEGNTMVTIIVTDASGNRAEVAIRVQVGVAPPPVILDLAIISPTDGMSFNLSIGGKLSQSTQVQVVILAGDGNGDITMTLQADDDEVVSTTPSGPITIEPNGETQRMTEFTLTAVGEGNTTVTIAITDNLGSTDTVTIRVQVDIGFRDCSSCPVMLVVPAGEFVMGSTTTEVGRDADEGPQHKVTIPKAFAVGKYEVTRGQYAEFAASTDTISNFWRDPGFTQTDNHPVVRVNWYEAKAYVAWLSEKTGQEYRLLSEAEWEYVARGGTTTPYSFGDTISPIQANYNNNNSGTVAVGNYPANAFGLHDVHGNVWEWVEDCWHGVYEGAPMNGNAWTSDCEGGDRRVLRGGSWFDAPSNLRSANRLRIGAWDNNLYVGFRIARTLTP